MRKKREGNCRRIARVVTDFNQHISTITFLLLACALISSTSAIPLQVVSENDTLVFNSTEQQATDDSDLLEAIQRHEQMETTQLPHQNVDITINPRLVSPREWKILTATKGPLITQVPFDIGPSFSPVYAHITSTSYKKYINDLEEKCRRTTDENIAGKRLETLDNDFFKWEEYQFNRALVNTLFPETGQGDNSRYLKATNVIHHIRLSNAIQSQCQIVEHSDNWSETVDEKTQFEDYLINRILPWIKIKQKGKRLKNRIKTLKQSKLNIDATNFNETIGNFTDMNLPTSNLLEDILVLQTFLARNG